VEDIVEELLPQLEGPLIRTLPATSGNEPRARNPKAIDLSPEERKVYALVSDDPMSIDELTEQVALGAATVAGALLGLELKNVVRQLPGQRYHRYV
jgi:DNA processing protein